MIVTHRRRIELSIGATALVALLVAPASARADALEDLRSRLRSVSATAPLRTRVEIVNREVSGEGRKARATEHQELIEAEVGPAGLRLGLSEAQVAKVQEGIRQARLASEAPQAQRIGAVPPAIVMNLLDAAFPLLVLLEGATLVSESPDPRGGGEGRILEVTPASRVTREQAAALKQLEESLRIWLDDEGWPVASHESLRAKAGKKLDFEMSTRIEYGRVPGRLFATDRKEVSRSVAKGYVEESTTHLRVTRLP